MDCGDVCDEGAVPAGAAFASVHFTLAEAGGALVGVQAVHESAIVVWQQLPPPAQLAAPYVGVGLGTGLIVFALQQRRVNYQVRSGGSRQAWQCAGQGSCWRACGCCACSSQTCVVPWGGGLSGARLEPPPELLLLSRLPPSCFSVDCPPPPPPCPLAHAAAAAGGAAGGQASCC